MKITEFCGKELAHMYRAGRLTAGDSAKRKHVEHAVGRNIVVQRSTTHDLAEYEKWFELHKPVRRASATRIGSRPVMDAKTLRRMVVMRMGGATFGNIGSATGFSITTVKAWLDRLPAELAA